MSRTTIDVWVGVFVAIGLGAMVFLSLKAGNLLMTSNTPGYRLEAVFDNIGGLKVRAPVKAAGVTIGRVESIALDPEVFRAVVKLRIEKQYEFTSDTIASILTSGLLGEVYVDLDCGGSDIILTDGEQITKTDSAKILEKLINQFVTGQVESSSGVSK